MTEHCAYLLDVTDRCPNERLLQEIVDILSRYRYDEVFFYRAVRGEPAVALPPRLKAYCEMQGVAFREIGEDEYGGMFLDKSNVFVPTFAARSLCGRIEEMRRAMEAGEVAVRARRARRFVVTDFSDGYMWHPVCVSLPAIILGGNMMSAGAKAAKMDLEKELCSVMDLPVGGLLQKLGTLYLRGGALKPDSSEFFDILAGDCGYSRHPGVTQFVLDEISGICRGVRIALERWTDRNDWAKEISYAANLLDCACHRRSEAMLRELRDEHGRIWRLRHAPEGRVESLSKLPRF